MKFTDKFVLVPIERYDRLTQGQFSNKNVFPTEQEGGSLRHSKEINNKQNEGSSLLDLAKPRKGGKGTKEGREGEAEAEAQVKDEELSSQKIQGSPILRGVSNLSKKTSKTKKQKISKPSSQNISESPTVLYKVPPPPPGIPHKIKNIDFRWFSLFK